MTAVDAGVIRLDQFLFGYRDGHRLLASSRKLPDDVASTLLLYSDLAPGLNSSFSPYWTAIPIGPAKAVALMRTWPAPEMPRPGCVWTHALLIPFAELARIDDLGVLQTLFRRPTTPAATEAFSKPTSVNENVGSRTATALPSRETVLGLVDVIYDAPPGNGVVPPSPDLEDAIFAFWSQQWPRLRRSFAFQTALTDEFSSVSPFDLKLSRRAESNSRLDEWKDAAAKDIASGGGALKKFLWQYGSDIDDGKLSYRILVEVYLGYSVHPKFGSSIPLLEMLGTVFPEAAQARSLKDSILGTEGETPLSVSPVDALFFLSNTNHAVAFGLPNPRLLRAAALNWKLTPELIARSGSLLLLRSDVDQDVVLAELSQGLDLQTLMKIAPENRRLFLAVLGRRPDLLDLAALSALPEDEIKLLVSNLPEDTAAIDALSNRLMSMDNRILASTFSERFPVLVSQRVFDDLASTLAGEAIELPQAWTSSIRDYLNRAVQTTLLNSCERQSQLAACVLILGLDVSAGLKHSTQEWARLLKASSPDITGDNKLRLYAFLLALALAKPAPGCEPIFEMCFDGVHEAIAVSRLPYDAFSVLAQYLPNLYYRDQWDTCLRLRLAVVAAYLKESLSLNSFRRLSSDHTIQRWLIDLAEKSFQGRQFLKGR